MRFAAFLALLLLGGLTRLYGQATPAAPTIPPPAALTLAPRVSLSADTALSRRLLGALRGFVVVASRPPAAPASPYLAAPARPEDAALLDELSYLDQPRWALPTTTYAPQVLGATPLDSGRYLVQLGYLGLAGAAPVLRATSEVLAYPAGSGSFAVGSPLRLHARNWRSTRLGSYTFRHFGPLDQAAAKAYVRQASSYDRRLGAAAEQYQTEVFACADLPEALRLLGVPYKADYAGYAHNSLSARANSRLLVLYAEGPLGQADPHDLWHQRLRNVVPAATINKAVDEGCAFRYGGSWGLTWPQILGQFQTWVAAHPNPDWLALYQDGANHAAPGQKPLLVRYTLNALVIEQLEKEKGFGAVRQLLACGPYEKSNDNYFRTLAEVTGITRATFNARMSELVAAARP